MRTAGRGNWTWLGGAALGAGLMYVFDPDRGRARRAMAKDKATRAVNQLNSTFVTARRDLGNRMSGVRARASRLWGGAETAEERALVERVRSQLGRCVSNPHAIRVRATQGRVVLSGPLLASEEARLRSEIAGVPGVTEVISQLEIYNERDSIPSLQGQRRTGGRHYWGPAKRVAAGTAGGVLVLSGLGLRSPLGLLVALAGAGLATRAASNREFRQLVGLAPGAIEVEKTIDINAAPERVFELWEKYENFPRFMSHVKRVQDLGGGRSRWTVEGPAGATVEFDARLTRHERPHLLAWKTDPGAQVAHEGMVRLEATGAAGTRVTVRMAYSPPAGALGHAVAALFGKDPKQQMDDDLARMKVFIETGTPPRDAAMAPTGVRPPDIQPPPVHH